MEDRNPKVILLHGCTKDEIRHILTAVRQALGLERYREFAFCTSTPANLEWKVKDLVSDVWEEHENSQNHSV